MRRLLSACATAAALSACAAPTGTQYFTLPESQYQFSTNQGSELAVRVRLAEPLNQGGLVYQTDAYHLNFARNHLWAAPLDSTLAASFSNQLNRLDPRHRFVPAGRSQSTQTLTLYIESFQGNYQGRTRISGYALWPDGRGRNFDIITPKQGDGYTAMVQSLQLGIVRAAEAIAP